jgi:hypothetical protein
MRRAASFLTWLSLVALLIALVPSAVSAAKPQRFTDRSTTVFCDASTADGFVSFFAVASETSGSFADLAFWAAPAEPFEDDPTIVATGSTVSGDASGMMATIELAEWDPDEDPPFGAATDPAILDVTLSPSGDPILIDDQFRDGNRWERYQGFEQPLDIEGTLTLPGADLTDMTGCGAAYREVTAFITQPSGYNVRYDEFSVQCEWETELGIVGMSVFADPFSAFGEVFVSQPSRDVVGGGDAILTPSELALEVELGDASDGSPVGNASAAASLTPVGDTTRTVEVDGRDRVKILAQLYSVDGDLDLTIDATQISLAIDDEHCIAQDRNVSIHSVRPAGPKPKPYPNDGPGAAIPLAIGQVATLKTGAGAEPPEAPCVVDDEFELPFGHTAWWSVTGTGDDLTADTAGSDFDTILGVYVRDGDDLVQVGCVDDVFDEETGGSLQASVTWASEAGVTYLLQAGGFAGQTGNLVLVVR